MNNNLKSICVLRLSAIGDVCHACAVVQRIQRMSPEAEITWIIGKAEAPLLLDLPKVKFIVFDKSAGLAGMRDVWRQVRGIQFDALLLMQVALRANLLSLGIRAKRRIGFGLDRCKELHSLFCNERVSTPQSMHVLDTMMAFADQVALNGNVQAAEQEAAQDIEKQEEQKVEKEAAEHKVQWQIPVSERDRRWADEQLLSSQTNIIICAGASNMTRAWSADGYAQLADYMAVKGARVILVGAPTENEIQLAAKIEQLATQELVNLVGNTSLKQLLALLANAQLCISPDTGPAHMASTVGTPVLGLYAHSDPRRTGPYFNQEDVVSVYAENAQLQYGKPVSELKWGTRNRGQSLMLQITPERVIDAVDAIMAKYQLSWR